MNGAPENPISGTSSSFTRSRIASATYGSSVSGSNGRIRAIPSASRIGSSSTGPRPASMRTGTPIAAIGTMMSREEDRGIERHAPERLQRELEHRLRVASSVEDVRGPCGARGIGQVPTRLAHEPHGGAVHGLTLERSLETVVRRGSGHAPQDTERGAVHARSAPAARRRTARVVLPGVAGAVLEGSHHGAPQPRRDGYSERLEHLHGRAFATLHAAVQEPLAER